MTVRKSGRPEKISAFDEIRYILSISARAQANYNALMKDNANPAKKYRLSTKSGIYCQFQPERKPIIVHYLNIYIGFEGSCQSGEKIPNFSKIAYLMSISAIA